MLLSVAVAVKAIVHGNVSGLPTSQGSVGMDDQNDWPEPLLSLFFQAGLESNPVACNKKTRKSPSRADQFIQCTAKTPNALVRKYQRRTEHVGIPVDTLELISCIVGVICFLSTV